ncbi:hypothetical protein MANES_15G019050v8 [Manihot esculenta]|uniref:Uncharacterized protein n=1 Tax=Manihot esculenta TaxID=3983 RepID=A0ACB7GAV4_MANES|nr:hypothetical protein MANES_15G019050v8 [Manihot esculenta]
MTDSLSCDDPIIKLDISGAAGHSAKKLLLALLLLVISTKTSISYSFSFPRGRRAEPSQRSPIAKFCRLSLSFLLDNNASSDSFTRPLYKLPPPTCHLSMPLPTASTSNRTLFHARALVHFF